MSSTDDLVAAIAPVIDVLQQLQIRHYIGGSVASSFHGAARSTMDVDLVCEMDETHISPFAAAFGDDYYISESAIRDAVDRCSCFNLIHLPTSFKVDIFVSRRREFDLKSMDRAEMHSLGDGTAVNVPIATAEDSIISKMEWYRQTGETSDRQWDDVSRLIRLLGSSADVGYLQSAAESVGVEDLLTRLLAQQ